MLKQLPLKLALPDRAHIENYLSIANQQAVADLTACATGRGELYVYLWGASGTGKSHLLQAATLLADQAGRSALYIPLDQVRQLTPALLEDLEQLDLVCLDDIEQVAGDAAWEQGLFNLFNRLRAEQKSLLVAARCSPHRLPIELPDLSSRLSWGLCYQLQTMSDQDKTRALIEDARRRGMEMSEESAGYILRHTPRDMGSLRQLVAQLDHASLAAQRRLTIPFIKAFLQQQRPAV